MKKNKRKITILGDSRTFDTYYYNCNYAEYYGYDRTFHFLLRERMMQKADHEFDVIHIPDHFRSYSLENNIMRLALTDPCTIILCNGIWETLVNKQMFIDYAVAKIKAHETRAGETLELKYNSDILAQLFIDNQLSNSPREYLERERRIISYFKRRRRQCIIMNLVVPDPDHLNRVHFAGNYRCIPEWDKCLNAINEGLISLARTYDAFFADIHDLVKKTGGFDKNLIDQWHFSSSFHAHLCDYFEELLYQNADKHKLGEDHISHKYMLHRELQSDSIIIYGTGDCSAKWIQEHPKVKIEGIIGDTAKKSSFHSVRIIHPDDIEKMESQIILLALPDEERISKEASLLKDISYEKIILYPEELQYNFYQSMKGY